MLDMLDPFQRMEEKPMPRTSCFSWRNVKKLAVEELNTFETAKVCGKTLHPELILIIPNIGSRIGYNW
jgi:hypothetical protein